MHPQRDRDTADVVAKWCLIIAATYLSIRIIPALIS